MASIREEDPERDIEGVVALIRESEPTAVITPESHLQRIRTVPARARDRGFVAEEDGAIVGHSFAFLNFFTEGSTMAISGVVVAEPHRRRGLGSELHELLVGHARSIGATSLSAAFDENPAGLAFARGLGYHEERAETWSTLDPRTVREQPPANVDLRPVADVDPQLVYAVDCEAMRDLPTSEPFDLTPYEEWEDQVINYPLFEPHGSFVAMVDGIAVAVALLTVDRDSGRAGSMLTGTLRAHRGRGFARAVKLASIDWAAENGITTMVTTNDERNAPMLAVNRRLGYQPAGRRVEWVR